LLKVVKDPKAYEKAVVQAYLDQEDFNESTMMDTTMWFKEEFTPDPDDTVTVEPNDTVYIRYNGRLLDGFYNPVQDDRIFDLNDDGDSPILRVIYGRSSLKITSGSILGPPKGFIEALDSMRLGTRAKVVLRYEKAFGEKGVINSTYKYTVIPVFQSVVYNIEVVDIVHPIGR